MMGYTIIHLTDIHLKSNNKDNSVMDKLDALKKACCSPIISGSPVTIAVSGDIAFSGKDAEYQNAIEFLVSLSDYISTQKETTVNIVMVPGNHDCDFDLSNAARVALQSNISNTSIIDDSVTHLLTEVQKTYRTFCELFDSSLDKDVVNKREISFNNNKILFLLVNTAWMSTCSEIPGKLVIHQNFLNDVNIADYKLVVTIMHHPNNWFNPDNAPIFQDYLRNSTDLLLVGHEHRTDNFTTEGKNWLINEKHGKELQSSNSEDSSFVIYYFDDTFSNISTFEYKWNIQKAMYQRDNESTDFFRRNSIINESILLPNNDTVKRMNDPGIVISHFSAEDIVLPEIYCWPELEQINFQHNSTKNIKVKDKVSSVLKESKFSLVIGDSLMGKTSLGKMMFLEFLDLQKCCIFCDGKDFNSCLEPKVIETIEETFNKQYSRDKIEKYRQLPKERKAIIIDNFDNLKFHKERRMRILKLLNNSFDNIILLSGAELDLPMLYAALDIEEHVNVQAYKILYMGNRKRHNFIHNWYYLRDDNSEDPDKEAKITKGVNLVNAFLGYGGRFVPAIPIFLINVLQNVDAFSTASYSGSQYGFLYESLINKSLSTISQSYKSQGAINIDINILSKLAFEMLVDVRTNFTKDDLNKTIHAFAKEKKLVLNTDALLEKMVMAKILYEEITNRYKFRYPYIFYYFTGRYIAYHLQEEPVMKKVKYMSSRLYNELYGNIMIFVCHFANNIKIIETILKNAYVSLNKYDEFDFNKKHDVFSHAQSIIDQILVPKYIGNDNDVERHKEESLTRMDDAGIQDGNVSETSDAIDDEVSDKERDLASITASVKTMDVLGQILQNYPGDIDGIVKVDIIDEVHKLGMRVIEALIVTLGLVEEDLISFLIEKAKDDKKNYSHEQIAGATKGFLSMLIAGMVRGMINKVAMSMSSEYLLPAVTESFEEHNTISEKLILQEIRYNCLRSPDVTESFKLYDELEKTNNQFALSILKSIVSHYLKYNRCDFRSRAKICSKFGFKDEKIFLEASINTSEQ